MKINKKKFFIFLFLIINIIIFSVLVYLLKNNSKIILDEFVVLKINENLSCIFLDKTFLFFNGFILYFNALFFIGFMIFLWKKNKKIFIFEGLINLIFSFLTASFIKRIIMRPRPQLIKALILRTSYSFPSLHTITALAIYAFAAIIFWKYSKKLWSFISLILIIIISFSRIYLGVHYPSDILGGLSLGFILLMTTKYLFSFLIKTKK